MSDPNRQGSSDREQRLHELIAAFLVAEDGGQPLDRAALREQHPEFAGELAVFFREHDQMRRLATPLRRAPAVAGSHPGAAPTVTREPSGDDRDRCSGRPTTYPETHDPGGTNGDAETGAGPLQNRVCSFGDYELRGVLGRGGMGIVYQVRQISLNRPVALKMLQAGLLATEDDLRRFQNEAEAVARLDHPHIVPIFEVGRHEERRYFTMKLVAGPGLAQRLTDFTADPRAAVRVVATVAEAVHHAHQRGVLHCDLKPANILLDECGQPYVSDFGLAKLLSGDSELTPSGAIVGTPAYMAPEQASGQRRGVTTATDVYGLGAILYALLTGQAPFQGDSALDVLHQVRERPPEPPSKLNPRVSRDLETICLKCLEKEPSRRYATAEELADDLGRYRAGEPIRARSTPLWERVAKWTRRHPATATLVVLGLAAVLGLGGAALKYDQDARNQERREDKRVAALRMDSVDALFKGRDALAQKNWTDGQLILSKLLTKIEVEPRLADLRACAADTLDQINRGLADQHAWEADRARYRQFLLRRNEALFHETQFTGLDLPSNRELTRKSARDRAGSVRRSGPGRHLGATTFATGAHAARTGRGGGGLLCPAAHLGRGDAAGRARVEGPRSSGQVAPPDPGLPPAAGGLPFPAGRRGGRCAAARRGRLPAADHGLRPVPDRPGAVRTWPVGRGAPPL